MTTAVVGISVSPDAKATNRPLSQVSGPTFMALIRITLPFLIFRPYLLLGFRRIDALKPSVDRRWHVHWSLSSISPRHHRSDLPNRYECFAQGPKDRSRWSPGSRRHRLR